MHKQSNLLIFTDLDGTLLDYHTYSKEAAVPALTRLRELDIPLIISSSKTRAEIEPMLDLPYMSRVFIVENGSAVFFRREDGLDLGEGSATFGDYEAIILGERYGTVLEVLHNVQKECGVKVRGFSDMSAAEIAAATGLDIKSASRAKQREFSEPFDFAGERFQLKNVIRALEDRGLACMSGGRFYHVLGRCDKGLALKKVVEIYEKNHPGIVHKIVALGDSENDIPLLDAADIAVIIKRHDGSFLAYEPSAHQEVIKPAGIGPVGWNEAVLGLIRRENCSP
jgi:mannosyl-3-phosphoglycerate phosphatase